MTRHAGLNAAIWVTASPHEWTWTREEQIAMARYCIEAAAENERLNAELKLWKPMTPEEAEQALAEVEAIPISDEEISRIVARVTDPTYQPTEPEHVLLAAKISQLQQRLAAVEGRLARIDAAVKTDADDLEKMRDGTKLTRAGLVQCIVYAREEAEAATDEARRLRERVKMLEGGRLFEIATDAVSTAKCLASTHSHNATLAAMEAYEKTLAAPQPTNEPK